MFALQDMEAKIQSIQQLCRLPVMIFVGSCFLRDHEGQLQLKCFESTAAVGM